MSQAYENASDVYLVPGNDASLFLLPIRAEKQLFSVNVPELGTDIVAAEDPSYEFITVRIPGRGVDASGNPDPTTAAYYQFLVNPHSLQVNRNTLDAQSLAKGGWQFGVWGEDFVTIHMEGKSPGRYYTSGLTALYLNFSASYRNLEALEVIFENNGYWFEGEKPFDGPITSFRTHRQIKMHTDVELMVGEFIWKGMFDSFNLTEAAEDPYFASFSLTFTAWKESYRVDTPYPSPITGAIERGHVPGVAATYVANPVTQSLVPVPAPSTAVVPAPSTAVAVAAPSPPASVVMIPAKAEPPQTVNLHSTFLNNSPVVSRFSPGRN